MWGGCGAKSRVVVSVVVVVVVVVVIVVVVFVVVAVVVVAAVKMSNGVQLLRFARLNVDSSWNKIYDL